MPKYRTLETVSYVSDGAVVSVNGNRIIELSEDQAVVLAGRVVLIESADSMFPDGSPILAQHLVNPNPATAEVEVEGLPEVKKVK